MLNPHTGKVSFFAMRGHAFGFGASVPNYCEGSTLQCIVAVAFMAAPTMAFIDDFTAVETEASMGEAVPGPAGHLQYPGSAAAGLWAVADLLSSNLAYSKEDELSSVAAACGVETDLRNTHIDGAVSIQIKPSTRIKALAILRNARRQARLSATAKMSLRGKLGYVMILGKAGRAVLQPFADDTDGDLPPGLLASFGILESLMDPGGTLPPFTFYG